MLKCRKVLLLHQLNLNINSIRSSSVQAQKEIKWEDAKPFSEIPGPKNMFQLLRLMGPGGRYANLPLNESVERFRDDFGPIVFFPGMFGMSPMVFTFLPEDIEKVHRLEGKYPNRRALDSIAFFRQQYRKDLYPAGAGLTIT